MESKRKEPSPVDTVTLKELNEDAYGVVRRARVGNQTIYLTYHGQFVAKLVPLTDAEVIPAALSHYYSEDSEQGDSLQQVFTSEEVSRELGLNQ